MTVYKNDYKAPSVDIPPNIHLDTKAEDYDLNFCLPVPSKPLRTDKVELRPFIVSCSSPDVAHLLSHQNTPSLSAMPWIRTGTSCNT